jgi:hypothetical protein
MPLTQQTEVRFERGDILFDMIDEGGTISMLASKVKPSVTMPAAGAFRASRKKY